MPALRIAAITPGTPIIGANSFQTAVVENTLTLTGRGFSPPAADNQVTLASLATPVLSASTTLTCQVPAGVPLVSVEVQGSRPDYQPATKPISARSVPSPLLKAIGPASGLVGTLVTIVGQGLLEAVVANRLTFIMGSGHYEK
ncbi:MAG: hypothetical protein EOO62_22295 [Hymenobacter sp.]|nr:MAG: hypothetical protein EOO62_22295 [Hymenobacter sp.]